MQLAMLDVSIILIYIIGTLVIGFWIAKRASKNMSSYFLGGNKLSWWTLGLSNASGQFDISGTMLMVFWLFVYGMKSIYIPWLWPAFNQIFLMVFLSIWLRRSGVMTGAEWIRFRFGESRGATLSNIIVIAFALCLVLGFLAYGFIGIGKFAAVFLPWQLSADAYWNEVYYGVIITAITTLYVVKGGMYSVVFTEVLQFFMMTIACIAVGVIAINSVSPEMIRAAVPEGWFDAGIAWELGHDWSSLLPAAQNKVIEEGMNLFGIFVSMVLLRGILVSLAGPAPNYDMQRILSARSPKEAAMMSGFVNVALLIPRYMLIAGLTVLAVVFFMPELKAMGPDIDFEKILPFAIRNYIPTGLAGLLIAGLIAAYMSTFAATTNAAPAYVVNDIYKRYFNPNAQDKTYVRLSYLVSIAFVVAGSLIGLLIPSLNVIVLWIVGALYGGYTAANVLKWYWWRFNGYGYFFGMLAGILVAIPLMFLDINELHAFPIILGFCLAACVVGSLLTPPDDMTVLKKFYYRVRPWGFWGPVYKALQQDCPEVAKNKDFLRDALNVVLGIVWHSCLTSIGILLVLQQWNALVFVVGVTGLISFLLKKNWYDNLENYPADYSEDKFQHHINARQR
ncbi:sodium:solute symporter family protein [Marinagarivorans algicola]|uniref:sodium:solute symporter family protein n=2 Tax=Marinagarivorans algicola TaxID=1513270 RepID=UPI0006B4C68F|nr:sodium:solute symporter family protein [Marinagarivorans algicola]